MQKHGTKAPSDDNSGIVTMAGRHVAIDIRHAGHGNMYNTHGNGSIPVFDVNTFGTQKTYAQYPHQQTAAQMVFSNPAAQGVQLSMRGGYYGSEV